MLGSECPAAVPQHLGERAVRLAAEMGLPRSDASWRARETAFAALARLGSRALGRSDSRTAERLLARAHETVERGLLGGELGPEGRAWLLRADAEHSRVTAPGSVELWQRALQEFGYGHRYEQARSGA
ncbi:MAG: hypothetical protein KY442_09625, partial [Proteobacteria bacterium]|nr:hypothetical protein [Pseudomonadota bacterium]